MRAEWKDEHALRDLLIVPTSKLRTSRRRRLFIACLSSEGARTHTGPMASVNLLASSSLPDLTTLNRFDDQNDHEQRFPRDQDEQDFYYESTPSPEVQRAPSPTPSLSLSDSTAAARSPSPPPRPPSAISDPGDQSRFYPASPTSDDGEEMERRPFSREGSLGPYPLGLQQLPFSLVDYLKEEIRATELDGFQELKTERITNFLAVPFAVERVHRIITLHRQLDNIAQCIVFGFVICLDSFLYTFTILPLRFAYAAMRLGQNYTMLDRRKRCAEQRDEPRSSVYIAHRHRLAVSHKCDLVKGILIVASCAILHRITDASQMYHSVRGQETLKLYVIYNVLEVRALGELASSRI